MWQYHNEDENLVILIHSDFSKHSGQTTVIRYEHAKEGCEMGTTTLSQCWSEQILPLSAPWTFCRTSCPTPGPKYPQTRGHGCAARAGPGLWTFLSVPRQHCNTHRHASHSRLFWGDTQQKQWPCSCNNQIELIWGQAGWLVCGIYHCPLVGHSECIHTQNIHTPPHPPLALCSSCRHCPPHRLHETPVTPGAGASTAETCSGARDAQAQRGSHLQDSAPQLSTLQSSWHYCSLDKPPRRVCTPGLLP